MESLLSCCCGLDIHQATVTACLLCPDADGVPTKRVRTVGTMTPALLELADWLAAAGCTHVAMESTGVYWKPLYNLFEDQFELLLVKAQHIQAVPGRKSDVKDSEWIAQLLQHGLLRASFVPNRPERELRELTRYRTSLVRERTAESNRLGKVLEGANIKLGSVASELLGVSSRAMLADLVAGQTDPELLADLAKGQLRNKRAALIQALQGVFAEHQRFLVAQQLAHIDFLDEQVATLSEEIGRRLAPFDELIERLDGIPGVGRWTAENLLAEIGTDMGRFPTVEHLVSWAGMCPSSDVSAGKRRSQRVKKGSPWLKVTLTEAAHAAGRKRGAYLAARYHRLAGRRGKKRAAIAVGHSILKIAYVMIRDGTVYVEPGAELEAARARERRERRLIRQLERLGNTVTVTPRAA